MKNAVIYGTTGGLLASGAIMVGSGLKPWKTDTVTKLSGICTTYNSLIWKILP